MQLLGTEGARQKESEGRATETIGRVAAPFWRGVDAISSACGPKARMTMAEKIEHYRGHRLEIRTFGPGWIVFIYRPGDMFACKEPPSTRDESKRDEVVTQAKAVVDRFFPTAAPYAASSFSEE